MKTATELENDLNAALNGELFPASEAPKSEAPEGKNGETIDGDFAHNWKTNGDERVCVHCKKVERKTIEMRPHEVWA